MKAVLIARVSDPEQIKALPAQTQRLISYANQRQFEFTLFEFDESAYSDARQKFREIVRQIEIAKSPMVVVFDKIDRFTRDSTAEEVKILDSLRKQGRIEIHFPSDNLSISKHSPAHDLFRLGIGIALAQYYSDSIRDNVKRRFEQMIREGRWPHRAKIGYINVTLPNGEKDIIHDTHRVTYVRKAFELYATGAYSVLAITRLLVQEGFTNQSGRPLTNSQIDELLQDPFYYGDMKWNGKTYPHRYEPLIARWLFEKCHEVRHGREKTNFKHKAKPSLFRGLIRCAYCGCAINPDTKKRKYTYLMCNQYKGKCGGIRIREEIAIRQVHEILEGIKIPQEMLELVVTELKKGYELEQTHHNQQINQLRKAYDTIESRLKIMYEDRLDGRISAEKYDEMVSEYKKKQTDINIQLEDHTKADESFLINSSYLLELAHCAINLFNSESSEVESKRQLLNFLLSNCTLEGDKLLFDLKPPFDAIYQANKNQIWLRRSDSNRRPRD